MHMSVNVERSDMGMKEVKNLQEKTGTLCVKYSGSIFVIVSNLPTRWS